MTGPTELLRHARRRAEELRPRYRAAGFWTAEPIDLVGPTAAHALPGLPSRIAAPN